jgi:NADH dehydrogenase
MKDDRRPHVVIIGGGFGGLNCAKSLARTPVRVTLIDRTNHHLFQPLLYQVAAAGLSPAEIAAPIRSVLGEQQNVTVLLDEVTKIDLDKNSLQLREQKLSYDYLVIAAGAVNNYFGKDAWSEYAPGMKTLDEAIEIRRRVLVAFEEAEREPDEAHRDALLTMVVIGGGPTGVEMAGALADLARTVLAKDFKRIDPKQARVLLIEGSDRVLSPFVEELSQSAQEQLKELGVELMLNERVERIDADGVYLKKKNPDDSERKIVSRTIVWAAGVTTAPVVRTANANRDRGGRIVVEKDLTIPGYANAYAIGDCAHFEHDGPALPGLCPVAIQMGVQAADNIGRALDGLPGKTFRYWDKGIMSTIGRGRAVAQSGPMKLTGFIAWVAWLFVHLWFLVGFRNRIAVFLNWGYAYLTYGRGARIITGLRFDAGAPSHEHQDTDGDMPTSSMRAQQVASVKH